MRRATDSSASRRRPVSTTQAPAPASATAPASPIPLPAPVIQATLPSKRVILCFLPRLGLRVILSEPRLAAGDLRLLIRVYSADRTAFGLDLDFEGVPDRRALVVDGGGVAAGT